MSFTIHSEQVAVVTASTVQYNVGGASKVSTMPVQISFHEKDLGQEDRILEYGRVLEACRYSSCGADLLSQHKNN